MVSVLSGLIREVAGRAGKPGSTAETSITSSFFRNSVNTNVQRLVKHRPTLPSKNLRVLLLVLNNCKQIIYVSFNDALNIILTNISGGRLRHWATSCLYLFRHKPQLSKLFV